MRSAECGVPRQRFVGLRELVRREGGEGGRGHEVAAGLLIVHLGSVNLVTDPS